MTDQPTTAAFDRTERAGSPGLVLLFAACLVGPIAAFSVLPKDQAGTMVIGLLTILAVIGIFALFGYAVGFFQFSGQAARNDLTRLICDSEPEGAIVTDNAGKILYANEAYMRLSGARDVSQLKAVERLLSGSSDVSESIYRLAQAAREGKRNNEELRLAPPLTGDSEVGWYRVRVRPLNFSGAKRATLWSVADVTRGAREA